jgi:undecaprenyl-diphosphatase
LAIFPGISRSGATISGGLQRNLNRQDAARFSFLLSIPIFLAAGIFSTIDLIAMEDIHGFLPMLLIGFLVSGVVGYLSIWWLLNYLKKKPLNLFGIYCLIVGVIAILVFYV